jgi:phytoene dehydrogenase-like protein
MNPPLVNMPDAKMSGEDETSTRPRAMPRSLSGRHFDAVVIGAGISGLAAAIRLAMHGKSVAVFERHRLPGGLNGYYNIGARRYDAGLHAMTNYSPPGAHGTPFAKILRQLRLRHEDFSPLPQLGSEIQNAGHRVRFSNDFALLESEVAREFPRGIDAFRRLDAALRALDATALDAPAGSARQFVAGFLADAALADLLFLPLSFYGSARANDMDLPQFAILWRSLFHEGFFRPAGGARRVITTLVRRLRQAGEATLRLGCGVRRLHCAGPRVAAVELDSGETLTAARVFSCAGLPETTALLSAPGADGGALAAFPPPPATPRLAFCEAITSLDCIPRDAFGWESTITFFCDSGRFHYAPACEPADLRSGVICLPENYHATGAREEDGDGAPAGGTLRVTALAGHAYWEELRHRDRAAYGEAKREWHEKLNATALRHLPGVPPERFAAAIAARDMFTPPTIERFTGRRHGAIYGVERKFRDGRTPLENLFLTGTDQGFLGITGAMLSGISMANLHSLRPGS